ncbi:MAG: hypothetical protein GOMPHAMPRED_001178 [Gomphillus americanus]|uniref:Uncharacterized protein n=1 Tax=Gomphillus americanus TaxID=1940652 RepID=A0A8H3IIN4_9LECA|nr:MAG: hypothetical protein GOMPHAMPRED_001178 [Gomphillus americanus]
MVGLPSLDTKFKAFVFTALIALALYLTAVYVLYPLYARRQRYAQYIPVSLDGENSSSFLGRMQNGLNRVLRPIRNTSLYGHIQYAVGVQTDVLSLILNSRHRERAPSFDSYFGDEELEDGVLSSRSVPDRGADNNTEQDSERRLSRELEAGFRDDSDSDDEHERRVRR